LKNPSTIVTALETPFLQFAGPGDPSEIVMAGLTWPTEYWVGLALAWVEQGAPVNMPILNELVRLGGGASLSQNIQHRAFALARQQLSALPINELDVVRVVALRDEVGGVGRTYCGSESVARAPRLGDVGTVVHAYPAMAGERRFEVEAVDSDGLTLWVADFAQAELKLEAKFGLSPELGLGLVSSGDMKPD
jgi:hypothetical protein